MTNATNDLVRRAFQQNKAAQAAFLASLGVDVTGMAYARKISLFCDASAPIAQLFAQLQPAATPTLCLVPAGVADASASRGGLTVQVLPALSDADYERLLWCCDFNFICDDGGDGASATGSTALARAQAAARPFIWQAAEAGQAAAFVERYSAALPAHAAATLRAASAAWNNAGDSYAALAACLAGPVNRMLTLHAAESAAQQVGQQPTQPPLRLDLFCRVVDNYGDIGICWRLARQLHREHGVAVTLYVDDLRSFQRICPEVDTGAEVQQIAGVAVRHWRDQDGVYRAADIADIVIEFFAVDIPPGYIAAMVDCDPRPVWLNLEGLTAEEWVEGCHTLPSSHPQLPLTKYFFFPGFTGKTGGLLLEAGLDQQRRQFQSDPAAMAAFLARFGVTPAEMASLKVSLFCYPHAPVAALFEAWQQGGAGQPVTCLVPEGVASDAVQAFLGTGADVRAGASVTRGALTLRVLPFVPQPDYDQLLWACDLNFVRGEDSFVRAQWAGRPFIWHIYPQDDNLHHKKLRAFLQRYAADLPDLSAFALDWNGVGDSAACAALWPALRSNLEQITSRAADWQQQMLALGDMGSNLLKFSAAVRAKAAETRV